MTAILDLGIDYGATGGPSFRTDITVSSSGYEQRRNYQSHPLGVWQIGERLVNETTLDKITSFFNAMRGRFQRFRYKDWNDYSANRFFGSIPGSKGFGKVEDGKTIQLYKAYVAVSGFATERVIYHPRAGTVKIWINGTQTTSFSVDEETGKVSNSLWNLSSTDVIEAEFEFYAPARFDTDELQATFENMEDGVRVYFLSSLKVKEVIPW